MTFQIALEDNKFFKIDQYESPNFIYFIEYPNDEARFECLDDISEIDDNFTTKIVLKDYRHLNAKIIPILNYYASKYKLTIDNTTYEKN